MSRYPKECPVFEYEGERYEGHPVLAGDCENTLLDDNSLMPWIWLEGRGLMMSRYRLRPLTLAARQMLALAQGASAQLYAAVERERFEARGIALPRKS